MDQGETSIRGALALFGLICIGIFATWVVLGPGDHWVAAALIQLQATVDVAANWYQKTVDGPSRLIAPAITIASGSYAIYKGYAYAESRLHFRLTDYLEREERRLAAARKQLRLIIERPNVDRRFREPIFLVPPLKRVVRELGWGSYFLGPQLGYVSFQLDSSIERLEQQVKLSRTNHRHLEHQLATAHLLRGAMYVADGCTAESGNQDNRPMLSSALNHFKSALAVDENDEEALEYAGHMHVCLKQDAEAHELLDRLLTLTASEAKSLSRARGFRYKAGVYAANGRKGKARDQLKLALGALPNLIGLDRIEEAEINEDFADRQNDIGNHRQARSHWGVAKALYDQIRTGAAQLSSERVACKLAGLDQQPDQDIEEEGAQPV